MDQGEISFIDSLRNDLLVVWQSRYLLLKPMFYSSILLCCIYLLKQRTPWVFMDLGMKDEAYGAMVFVSLSLLHGILLTNVFSVIWEQDEKIKEAFRKNDFESFVNYFLRRIPPQMKVLIFFLSVCIVYSAASCDLGSPKNNYIALGMTLMMVTLAWFAAYEMDDPLVTVRNIKPKIPKEWEKLLEEHYIAGTFKQGKIRLKRDAEFICLNSLRESAKQEQKK